MFGFSDLSSDLNPGIKKDLWLHEEDKLIIDAHQRIGSRWSEIAKLLEGRTGEFTELHAAAARYSSARRLTGLMACLRTFAHLARVYLCACVCVPLHR